MIGLSGVGKTTLFYSMGNTLFQDLGCYRTVHPLKPSKLRFLFETIKLITKITISYGFFQSFIFLKSNIYIQMFMKLGYRISSMKIRSLSGLVYLRDSGVLMPLISSVIDDRLKIDDTLLLKILINLPLPKYVYCIMDSPDDIYSRFITREKKIGNDVNGYTVTDFKNANIFLSLLIEKLKSIGVNVVVLNKESFVL
jgi:GTPase SAR1 family protein